MRNFLNYWYILSLVLCVQNLRAQNSSAYNSFYLNPFVYNPAEAISDQGYIYLHHRQQWTGVDGAPKFSAVSFNTLLNESRAGIGVKLSNYSRGLLSSNDFSLAYAYGIPVSKKNWLLFGLSGGALSHKIDLAKISDPTDPALATYLNNNIQPAASFGMVFRTEKGFNLSVAVPQLFTPKFNSPTFEHTQLAPQNNIFISAYYRGKVEGKMVNKKKGGMRTKVKTKEMAAPLELYFNYRYTHVGTSQFEFLTKLNLSENFWLGASYRMPYGFTGNVGLSFERFILAYSYELYGQPEPGFSRGTHDITIGLKVGDPKKLKKQPPLLRSTVSTQTERHTARFQDTSEDPDNINRQATNKKIYYVIIKSFTDFTQADLFKKKLIGDKYNANVYYHVKDKKFYVHVLETTKSSEAYEEARNLKNYTKLNTASVLTVESNDK
jgi:type IX secretion system PorP/SprF family membrane protein